MGAPCWFRQVFRKLQQFVPEFNKFTVANAVQNPQGAQFRIQPNLKVAS